MITAVMAECARLANGTDDYMIEFIDVKIARAHAQATHMVYAESPAGGRDHAYMA